MKRLATIITAALVLGGLIPAGPAQAQSKELRFSIHCRPGPVRQVDPLVSPGQPSHHLHQFFGNTGVTQDREPVRVMRQKPTTCALSQDTGAYWIPVLRDAQGDVIPVAHVLVYYRHSTTRGNVVRAHLPDTGIVSPDHVWMCKDSDTFSSPPDCTGRPSHPDGAGLRIVFRPTPHPDGGWTPNVAFNVRYTRQNLTGARFDMGVGAHGDFWNTWRQRAYRTLVSRCLDPTGVWRTYTDAQWEARCSKVTDASFALGN